MKISSVHKTWQVAEITSGVERVGGHPCSMSGVAETVNTDAANHRRICPCVGDSCRVMRRDHVNRTSRQPSRQLCDIVLSTPEG